MNKTMTTRDHILHHIQSSLEAIPALDGCSLPELKASIRPLLEILPALKAREKAVPPALAMVKEIFEPRPAARKFPQTLGTLPFTIVRPQGDE